MDEHHASGPVMASGALDVAAAARGVWAVLADIDAWPTWNPAVRDTVSDELEPRAYFRFATGPGTMSCRLLEVDAPRSLAWSGRLMGVGHRYAWRIQPGETSCRVELGAAMTGLVARILRGRLQRRLQGDVDTWLQLLKLEAETRVSESPEEGEDVRP